MISLYQGGEQAARMTDAQAIFFFFKSLSHQVLVQVLFDLVICKHRKECGTWHWMSLLKTRPDVIKTTQNSNPDKLQKINNIHQYYDDEW